MSRLAAHRYLSATLALATLGVIFSGLEFLILMDFISQFVMPRPSTVVASLWRVLVEESIPERFMLTTAETFGAGAAVTVIGVAIGFLLARLEILRRATETWIAAFASAPLVLAYPLFLVIFGRNALTIAAMGFFAALAPVILKTVEGLTSVRPVFVNVGRSLQLTPMQLFWKVEFPAALPTIFVGLRLGLILALINVVGLEFLINFGGLGQLINDLAERYDLPGTYAAICFVVLVSVLFFFVLERVESWLRPGR